MTRYIATRIVDGITEYFTDTDRWSRNRDAARLFTSADDAAEYGTVATLIL